MSDDFEFHDLRADISVMTLDDVIGDSLRNSVRRMVNSSEERRIRGLAEERDVDYTSAHSLVKVLYKRLAKKSDSKNASFPHEYETNARRVVEKIDLPLISNAAQWLYIEAKRNGLVATFDEDIRYSAPLAGMASLSVQERAYAGIVALFSDAADNFAEPIKPFQIGRHPAVLSRVGKYFSPEKDAESLLLLYNSAKQRGTKNSDEEI